MGKPENSVQFAIEDACQRFNVPCFREQSRVITIGNRPVFFGKWRDALGVWHSCGKADYLITPRKRVEIIVPASEFGEGVIVPSKTIAVSLLTALWVEAKAGKERPPKKNRCMCGDETLDHQEHFRKYVTGTGAYHLVVRDSADALIQWFKEHGVI